MELYKCKCCELHSDINRIFPQDGIGIICNFFDTPFPEISPFIEKNEDGFYIVKNCPKEVNNENKSND